MLQEFAALKKVNGRLKEQVDELRGKNNKHSETLQNFKKAAERNTETLAKAKAEHAALVRDLQK